MSGFGTRALSGVVVTLGETTDVPITLQLATVTEAVVVTADASSVFSPGRSGTTASVAAGVIETLPTSSGASRTSPERIRSSSRRAGTPTPRASSAWRAAAGGTTTSRSTGP